MKKSFVEGLNWKMDIRDKFQNSSENHYRMIVENSEDIFLRKKLKIANSIARYGNTASK